MTHPEVPKRTLCRAHLVCASLRSMRRHSHRVWSGRGQAISIEHFSSGAVLRPRAPSLAAFEQDVGMTRQRRTCALVGLRGLSGWPARSDGTSSHWRTRNWFASLTPTGWPRKPVRRGANDMDARHSSARDRNPQPRIEQSRTLGDALRGDTGLFTGDASLAAAWRVIDPVLGSAEPVEVYDPGTWGAASAAVVVTDEHGWHDPKPEMSAPC